MIHASLLETEGMTSDVDVDKKYRRRECVPSFLSVKKLISRPGSKKCKNNRTLQSVHFQPPNSTSDIHACIENGAITL